MCASQCSRARQHLHVGACMLHTLMLIGTPDSGRWGVSQFVCGTLRSRSKGGAKLYFSQAEPLAMSDTCMSRCWRKRVLLWTLAFWTLLGLCCAGNRPLGRWERPRDTRLHDRSAQRIQYPLLHEQGTQRIVFPSLNDQGVQVVQDEGQSIQYPSLSENSQVQVNFCKDETHFVAKSLVYRFSCSIFFFSVSLVDG